MFKVNNKDTGMTPAGKARKTITHYAECCKTEKKKCLNNFSKNSMADISPWIHTETSKFSF